MGLLAPFDKFLQVLSILLGFNQFPTNSQQFGWSDLAGKLWLSRMTNFLQKKSFLSKLGGKCRTAFTIAMIDRVPFSHLNLKFTQFGRRLQALHQCATLDFTQFLPFFDQKHKNNIRSRLTRKTPGRAVIFSLRENIIEWQSYTMSRNRTRCPGIYLAYQKYNLGQQYLFTWMYSLGGVSRSLLTYIEIEL